MIKKLGLLFCILIFSLILSGCTLFDTAEYEVSEYSAETEETSVLTDGYISDYSTLKRAITQIISRHEETPVLQFQNYDGNISRDISQACWEIKSSTAIGAYAVDYVSFDLNRIVSYYQANLYITYKRSAEQISSLERVSGKAAITQLISDALSSSKDSLVLRTANASLSTESINELISNIYYSNALITPVFPTTEVNFYPQTGMDRIIELSFHYDQTKEELAAMQQQYSDTLESIQSSLFPEAENSSVVSSESVSNAIYESSLRLISSYIEYYISYNTEGGSTAYAALTTGNANDQGIAMAFLALCNRNAIDCTVVSGRTDEEVHYWNIVTFNGNSYHVDISASPSVFLVGNESLPENYWWDTAEYPTCQSNYYSIPSVSEEPSFTIQENSNA